MIWTAFLRSPPRPFAARRDCSAARRTTQRANAVATDLLTAGIPGASKQQLRDGTAHGDARGSHAAYVAGAAIMGDEILPENLSPVEALAEEQLIARDDHHPGIGSILQEFAANGLSGALIDEIARRTRASKRMTPIILVTRIGSIPAFWSRSIRHSARLSRP